MTAIPYYVNFTNSSTGLPITGLTPSWHYVTDAAGDTISSPPSFTSMGNGRFSFLWDPYASGELFGMVDGGSSISVGTDRYKPGLAVFAAPLQAQDVARVAAAILANTANKLAADSSGNVLLSSTTQNAMADAIITRPITEAYSTFGTPASYSIGTILFDIRQRFYAFKIVGTILSILKLDGTTTAHQLTLDSATGPTQSIQSE